MAGSSAPKRATFAALLLASACAGPGAQVKADSGAPGDPKAVAAADPGKKVVCTFEVEVGSHIPQKVCRKQEEIDAARARAREDIEHIPGAGNQAVRSN